MTSWGDPDAPFPYCLTYEEYQAAAHRAATYGLSDEQLAGTACVRCGVDVGEDAAKVGVFTGQWHNVETDEVIPSEADLRGCRACEPSMACPWWCERGHLPVVRGNSMLDGGVHKKVLASITTGEREQQVDVVLLQYDSDGGPEQPYIVADGGGVEHMTASTARQVAAALLNAADMVEQLTSGEIGALH